jgi:hypothetical protein
VQTHSPERLCATLLQSPPANADVKEDSLKRLIALLALAVASAAFGSHSVVLAGGGNGAPSGYHYDLNIHGVTQGGTTSTNYGGHDIWVSLNKAGGTATSCKIELTQGPFAVTQPNCLATGTAGFQLPNPISFTCGSGATSCTAYAVYARVVGQSGGANMTTCALDTTSNSYYCPTQATVTLSKKTFGNVTSSLLYYCNTNFGTTSGTLQPIFSNGLSYAWSYDNTGARLAQLRFYPIQSANLTSNPC